MKWCLSATALTLWSALASAQGVQTGSVQGTARDADGLVLPGVMVTATSPALQGARVTTTDDRGVYVLRGLPGGEYVVVFEREGFARVEERASVSVGLPTLVNAGLPLTPLAETVHVTGTGPASALTSTAGTANYRYMEVQTLPSGRTPQAIAQLSPGLTTNTPNPGQLTIHGAFAYDNVFLIDGVDVNDNLLGTANNLFIEDAIEETQVLSSGISAEFGRFSGGVINVVTKSGGDLFSGTLRSNVTRDDWQARTPFEQERGVEKSDTVNLSHEGTVGGPILRSRLWFFGAGRFTELENTAPLAQSGAALTTRDTNTRYEAKLTGTVADTHTISGSYMDNSRALTGVTFPFTIDPHLPETATFPNTRSVVTYRGVLSPRLFADARYSQKQFGRRGAGGTSTALQDSPMLGLSQLVHYNGPYFDATDPEDRSNYQAAGSLAYVVASPRLGSHDLKAGGEIFNSYRTGGNSQSATGYVLLADYLTDAAGAPVFDQQSRLIPRFAPGATFNQHWLATRGARVDLRTTSLYLQDHWRPAARVTIDVGTRYERVRGSATGGLQPVDTDTWVPRLAGTYDLRGDGRYVVQATYAWYAGRYTEGQFARNTDVGNPAGIYGAYIGPPGMGRDFAPGFDPANYVAYDGTFPTANVFLEPGLSSPVTREFTTSFGTQIGRGFAKATLVDRDVRNFVEDFISVEGGTTTVIRDGQDFGTFQNVRFRNSNLPERRYRALSFQSRYPLGPRLHLYANYTRQLTNDGTFEGEAPSQPGISSLIGDRPEIYAADRHVPSGRLEGFQQDRVRAWGIYTQPLGFLGAIDLAMLYRYDSGTTYSLLATRVPLTDVQRALGSAYATLPSTQTLYFGDRGSERFAGAHLWDLGLNYSIPVLRTLRPYVKLDVFNLLDNDTLIRWNTVVTADRGGPLDALGLPTTYVEGANFGRGTANTHYPPARRFELAVGFRF